MNEKQNSALAYFWLQTATSTLCDQARARIAVEIKAHYADLVETHLAEGMEVIDARLKALEDLGDAEVATRKFRKQHLTMQDEKWIAHVLGANRALVIAVGLFLYIVLLFLCSPGPATRAVLGIVCFVTFGIFPAAAGTLANRVKKPNSIGAVLLLDMGAKVGYVAGVLFIFFYLLPEWPLRPIHWVMLTQLGAPLLIHIVPTFKAWRKFNREQKRHGETVEIV